MLAQFRPSVLAFLTVALFIISFAGLRVFETMRDWDGNHRSDAAFFTSNERLGNLPQIRPTTTRIGAVLVVLAEGLEVMMVTEKRSYAPVKSTDGLLDRRKGKRCQTINAIMPNRVAALMGLLLDRTA